MHMIICRYNNEINLVVFMKGGRASVSSESEESSHIGSCCRALPGKNDMYQCA